MPPAPATRPVLIAALGLALGVAGCGAGEGRSEATPAWATRAAAIDIGSTIDAGRRSIAFTPMRVAVLDPHDMWDARDAQQQGRPYVVRAAVVKTDDAGPDRVATPPMRATPPVKTPSPPPAAEPGRTIQLGAYASTVGAQEAWGRMKTRPDLAGLSPAYEQVRVHGRTLTRLKVGPIRAEAAAHLCRAAQVADPWCRQAG